MNRIDYLDGWRGLAILFVLISHFSSISKFIELGRFGVDVFFCLSGFLMSNILFIKKIPLTIFYKRRISRIIPVFWLYITVKYLADYLASQSNYADGELLSTMFFMRTYSPITPDIRHATGIIPIGHFWSLNVEEHCYLFLSLITFFKLFNNRSKGKFLILIGIISILTHVFYFLHFSQSENSINLLKTEANLSFLFLSAGYFLIRIKNVPSYFPILTFLCAGICYFNGTLWWTKIVLAPFLLAFTINHLSDTPFFIKNFLSIPTIRYLGIWSYSIYIWQQPFYKYAYVFPKGSAFIPAILLGIMSFYCFENPVRKFLNNKF
jgi:peptidoglycan/LPS O-acetylase OafA/YrhL